MRVLMTTDGIGGVWNYSVRLAEALREYDVQIALAMLYHQTYRNLLRGVNQ